MNIISTAPEVSSVNRRKCVTTNSNEHDDVGDHKFPFVLKTENLLNGWYINKQTKKAIQTSIQTSSVAKTVRGAGKSTTDE